jgi:hypothetical protein
MTSPNSENMAEQFGQAKTSGLLFHTFPEVPQSGHLFFIEINMFENE